MILVTMCPRPPRPLSLFGPAARLEKHTRPFPAASNKDTFGGLLLERPSELIYPAIFVSRTHCTPSEPSSLPADLSFFLPLPDFSSCSKPTRPVRSLPRVVIGPLFRGQRYGIHWRTPGLLFFLTVLTSSDHDPPPCLVPTPVLRPESILGCMS